MIVGQELELLREEAVKWLPFTCDIFKVVSADDAYGGRTREHPVDPTYTDIPCNVESGAAHEQERSLLGLIAEIQVFTVFLPALTDVNVGDHIVAHTEDHPNLHLLVQAEMAPEGFEVERRLIATEVGTAVHA
jgi:hypothetical protein